MKYLFVYLAVMFLLLSVMAKDPKKGIMWSVLSILSVGGLAYVSL